MQTKEIIQTVDAAGEQSRVVLTIWNWNRKFYATAKGCTPGDGARTIEGAVQAIVTANNLRIA